jgi:LacI family transcriptional regulator
MAVTLSQIAKNLGVSVPVVAQALNPGRSSTVVSEATQQRVREAAAKMGYRPNLAARALKNRSFHSIGLLVAGAADRFFLPQDVIMGISRTLAPHRYSCVLVSAGKLDEETIADQQLLSEYCVDAILVGYADDPPPALIRAVNKAGVPAVWLFRRFPSNCLTYDEAGGAAMLTEHLAQQGHKKITYLDLNAGGRSLPHTRDRLDGFHAAAGRLSITTNERVDERVARADRPAFARALLSGRRRPRAIITDSCSGAASIIGTALQMGLKVPRDLAVASFDNGSISSAFSPTITAAISPERRLGIAAAEMAMQLVEGSGPRPLALPPATLPYELHVGNSTTYANQ